MARAAKFPESELLASATRIAAEGGAAALTMQRLAADVGAPSGSVYHRYRGRAHLLAEVWLGAAEAFQADWSRAAAVADDLPELATFPVRWARAHRAAATILAAHRAEDFMTDDALATQRARARAVREVARPLLLLTERFFGRTDRPALSRVTFALVTLPLAALRQPLSSSRSIPADLEEIVRDAARGALSRVGASSRVPASPEPHADPPAAGHTKRER